MASTRWMKWALPVTATTLVVGGLVLGMNPLEKIASIASNAFRRFVTDTENEILTVTTEGSEDVTSVVHKTTADTNNAPGAPSEDLPGAPGEDLPDDLPHASRKVYPHTCSSSSNASGLPVFREIDALLYRNRLEVTCRRIKGMRCRMPVMPSFISGSDFQLVLDENANLMEAGCGNHSICIIGKLRRNGLLLAIKMVSERGSCLDMVLQEGSIFEQVSRVGAGPRFFGVAIVDFPGYHDFALVAEFIGDPSTLLPTRMFDIVVAWLGQGSIEVATDNNNNIRVECLQLLLNVISVLERIHQVDIIVNDIKSDNILFRRQGSGWRPYFIDFGSAHYRYFNTHTEPRTNQQIAEYRKEHPEMDPHSLRVRNVSKATDVFSLGYMVATVGKVLRDDVLVKMGQACMLPSRGRPTTRRLTQMMRKHLDHQTKSG